VLDTIVLKLPILGLLMRKNRRGAIYRETLGTLISSGVPILEGLDITAKTAGNAVVERALQKVRRSLEEGKSAHRAFERIRSVSRYGHADDCRRRTRRVPWTPMLQKIADFYEEEVDAAVKDLLTALEPIMIVFFLGLVVGRRGYLHVLAIVLAHRQSWLVH